MAPDTIPLSRLDIATGQLLASVKLGNATWIKVLDGGTIVTRYATLVDAVTDITWTSRTVWPFDVAALIDHPEGPTLTVATPVTVRYIISLS